MKTLITVVLFLFTMMVFSQDENDNFLIEKSTWTIEGDFGIKNFSDKKSYTNSNEFDDNYFNFSIAPKIGYAINDNFILGLGFAYNYSERDYEGIVEQAITINSWTTNSYSVFPYVKKFFPIAKKLSLHLVAETRFSIENISYESSRNDYNTITKAETFSINIRPGVNYRITNKFMLQANFGSLGYSHSNEKYDVDLSTQSNDKENSIGLNFGTSSLYFGFVILL